MQMRGACEALLLLAGVLLSASGVAGEEYDHKVGCFGDDGGGFGERGEGVGFSFLKSRGDR